MRALALAAVPILLVACDSDTPGATPAASQLPTSSPTVAATPTVTPSARPTVAVPPSPEGGLIRSPERRSPHGDLVAYVEFAFGGCPTDCAVVFERGNGIEVTRVPFDDPGLARIASAWAGYTIDAWLDDGTGAVLGGSCECDGDGPHPIVIVRVNGTVVDQGVSALMGASGAHVSPNGRYLLSLEPTEVAWEIGVGCAVNGSGVLVDLISGDVVASIPGGGTAFVDWEWLDGANLAYARRALPSPEDGMCDRQLLTWSALPVDWSLLTIP